MAHKQKKMSVEDLVREITALSVTDRVRLRQQLGVIELFENNIRRNCSARFEVNNEAYGKIEGCLYFGPLLREVGRRFQQKAFPQDATGKKVNDGPTIIATGDGVGGFISQRIDGPVDSGALSAFELIAFNMLSDSKQYEDFFQDALERLAALIEDRVISMFENKNYLGPNHIEQRKLRYTEGRTERRNKAWRPSLKENQKFKPGRPLEKEKFENDVETALQSLRKKQIKITQENVAEEMDYKSVRAFTKQLEAYEIKWRGIKNRN